MRKSLIVLLALVCVGVAAAVAKAMIPAGDSPSGSWAWSADVPGIAVAAPDIAISSADQSGVDSSKLREVISARGDDGSLDVLAGPDSKGNVCLGYTRAEGSIATLFKCLVGVEADKPVILFSCGGGSASDSVSWATVAGAVRSDVTRVTLRFADDSERDLPLNSWRAFSYYAGSVAAIPSALLAFNAEGTKVAEFDLHSLATPLIGSG
jgi:hypothetical protein